MENKKCIHYNVCKYGAKQSGGMYCTGEKCKQFKDESLCLEIPLQIGDKFIGLLDTGYKGTYEVLSFKYGKHKKRDENVLFVVAAHNTEFVWGEDAFATEKDMEKYFDKIMKQRF